MQVLYERCAGLDVHKKTVVACVLVSAARQPAITVRVPLPALIPGTGSPSPPLPAVRRIPLRR